MDRIGSLSVFVQVAESRSFTTASRHLGVSSSAVGKVVGRLEERLGVRLFHRSTRSMTLTSEGEMFLARCRRIVEEIEAAEEELVDSSKAPRGKLRVSLPLIGMVLMPLITDFMKAYREIELDLDFSDRLVDLIEEGFDLVLRTGEVGDSRLMMRVVGSYSFAIVASPAYLSQHGEPGEPEDLLEHACLHHRYPTSGKFQPWRLVREGKGLELDLPYSAVANTLEPLIDMAERGLGLVAVPTFTIRSQLADGRLMKVLQPFVDDSTKTFKVLWPASRYPSPKVRAFIEFMDQRFLSEPRAEGPDLRRSA